MALRRSRSRGRSTRPKVTIRVNMQDNDMGFESLKNSILAINGTVASVGILAPQANLLYDNGEKLVDVAYSNEMGIGPTHPERSFLRKTFDEMNDKWFRNIAGFMRKQVVGNTLGERVVEFSGKMMQGDVKRTVKIMKTPKNAPRTIKGKGFDDPLIHTSKMYNNIKYDISKEGKN